MKKMIIIVSIILIMMLLFGFYLYFQNTVLEVTKHEILDSKIPENFNNYKIIQISDFHNTSSKKLSNMVVSEIKKQAPDMIVITGDFIDSRNTNLNVSINFLKEIKDIASIYYIAGNHESRTSEYKKLKSEMLSLGINILENKVIEIQKDNDILNLIGINDPSFTNNALVEDSEIIKTEINDLIYNKDNYTILLSHRPESFKIYVDENIDLIFSGHAHGGQIRIPIIGGIVAPNQGLFPKYTTGKYVKEDTTMIVSRGIGNSLFPFRINNRPELIVVNLKKW